MENRSARKHLRSTEPSRLSPKQHLLTKSQLIQPVPSHAARTREIDELVNSVLGDSRPSSTGPRLSGSPARADSRSRPGSVFGGSQALGGDRSASGQRVSDGSGGHLDIQRRASSHSGTQYSTTATQTLSSESTTAVFEAPVAPKRDVETYSKAVQTEEWEPRRSTTDSGDMAEDDWAGEQKVHSDRNQAEILTKLRKEVEQELRQALEVDADNKAPHDDKFPVRVLNTEEMEAVTASEDFMMFIGQSTKVIERALDEPYDLLTDYAEGKLRVGDEEDGYRGRRGRRVKETVQYYDERWSKKRMISDIGFSPKVSPYRILRPQVPVPNAVLKLVSGAASRVIHQESLSSSRTGWHHSSLEFAYAVSARVCFPCVVRYSHRQILSLPSILCRGRMLQRPGPGVGHEIKVTFASSENASHWRRSSSSSIQHRDRGYAECQQHHKLQHGWSGLHLVNRYVGTAAGVPRASGSSPSQN